MKISLQDARQLRIKRRDQREDYLREMDKYKNNQTNQNDHSKVVAQINRYEAIIAGIDKQIELMSNGVQYRFQLSEGVSDEALRKYIQDSIDTEPSDLWLPMASVD